MTSRLVAVREPNRAERKRGAEVVFERREGRVKHTVLGCACYESWEQWGAPVAILADNMPAIERWRHEGMEVQS